MIGRGRGNDDRDVDGDVEGGSATTEGSPWASDSIPVGTPSTQFEWRTTGPDESANTEPGQLVGRTDGGIQTRSDLLGSRPGAIVSVIAVIAVIAGSLIVLWPDSDGNSAEPDAVDDRPSPSLDTLPDAADEPVDDSEPAETEPDSDTTEADAADDSSPDALDASAQGVDATDALPELIELPPEVAAIGQPTEVVMLADGAVRTLSIPSGQIRTAALVAPDDQLQRAQLVAAPDAAMVSLFDSELVIVPRSGPPTSVDIDAFVSEGSSGFFVSGWFRRDDGSTAFQVTTFANQSASDFTVDISGVVEPADADSGPLSPFSGFDSVRADGRQIVNEAGGVYRIDPDGSAQLVAAARAYAANDDQLLLRECDEALNCRFVVLSEGTGERRVVDIEREMIDSVFDIDLSPDGTAIAGHRSTSSGNSPVIVDFDGGEAVGEPLQGRPPAGSTPWAPDSSGVFMPNPTGDGLHFLDRATGDSTQFATELGNIRHIAVRAPDSELPAGETTRSSAFSIVEPLSSTTDLELVVLGRHGVMAHVDIDAGVAVSWNSPVITGGQSPELFPSGDTVVALGPSTDAGFVSRFGTTEPLAEVGVPLPRCPRHPGPGGGLVWAPGSDETVDIGVDQRLFVVNGSLPASDTTELVLPNGSLLGGDSTGGLVVEVGGDVFIATRDGRMQLTTGELLAIGASRALVRECDAQLSCEILTVNRATGERSRPDNAELLDGALSITADRPAPVAATMSPDGTVAVINVAPTDDGSGWAIVDLLAGTSVEVEKPEALQPIVWNDTSTLAAMLFGDDLQLFDREAGRISATEGLGAVRAITAVTDEFRRNG